MKNFLLVLCCWLAMTASAQTTIEPNLKWGKPTEQELTMTVYEEDKDAPAVVLCQLTNVSYTMDFHNYFVNYEVKTRIKVLTDAGKDYANVTIVYTDNPQRQYSQEEIEDFKAVAYNLENGKVKKTKIGLDQIFKERVNDDYIRAKVAIPQVKVGTVIEYEYKLHSNIFYSLYDWEAQREIPVVYTNYRLEVPTVFVFNVETAGIQQLQSSVTSGTMSYQMSSDNLAKQSKRYTNIYNCTGRNLRALKKDDYVWNVDDYCTKVTAELQSYNFSVNDQRDMRKTWEQVDNTLFEHTDFGSRLYKHSKYRDELLAKGIDKMDDLKEKVAATFQFLRQRLVWNGEYKLLAKSPSEVIKNGSGANSDLNMILINMLGDVGVKAYPVLMSTRRHGRLPKTYPSLNKINTFIVGIPNGVSWIYLDASCTDGYLNVLPPNLYVEQARIIDKDAQGQWVNLQKIGEARSVLNIKASLSADGQIKGEQTTIYSGNAAANERKAFREASDSTSFIAAKATQNGVTITQCKIEGLRDFSPSVSEMLYYTKQGDKTDDHIYINPFTELPISSNPFAEKGRLLPVEFPCRNSFNAYIQLTLPDGWLLEEMPKSVNVTTPDKSASGRINYALGDDNTVTINYQFRTSNVCYDHKQYDALSQLFDLFANRGKDMLVIKKK
jgi:hypothetical protein